MADWRDPGECEHPQRYIEKDPCGCLICTCGELLEYCGHGCYNEAFREEEVADELAFNDEGF